ncbi:major facilitator superfamily domain-containing protein [Mycena latifolia]|nr:major facilitator superfamily domain-containing protein [Mycena latifolia]
MSSDARFPSRHRTGRSISSISTISRQNPSVRRADDEDIVELSADPVHPHENPLIEENEGGEAHLNTRHDLPRWKRPAPWWLMVLAPISSLIAAATVAPQVELYTTLACRVHRPEFESETLISINISLPRPDPPNFPRPFNILVDKVVDNASLSTKTPDTNPCSSDPVVQAAVAKFNTVISTLTGILTFVTVGWWGSFSDRHGRRRMMGIAAVGQLISSLNILFVAKYVDRIPGGYWLLVVDAAIAGALGGSTSETAAMFAYISDVSTPEKRSRLFSIVSGFYLAGFGVGPILGSLIVRVSHNILSVFYMAAAFRIIQTCFIWFILPESLSTTQMQRASIRHRENSIPTGEPALFLWLKRLFFFLQPLSNLPILVLAYGLMLLASASLVNQFLYALYTFGWGSEWLGYCISSIGITRAIYLTLILPLVIKFAKSRKNGTSYRSSESEPLLSDQDADSASRPAPVSAHASTFDLGLARFSMLVDIATFAALPFAPTGLAFIFFTMLGSMGGGLNPAINSVALEIYSRKFRENEPVESGKLFGALSVVQSVFTQILAPPLYGLIYAATVATFPRTIFFVALGTSIIAFALLSCVRLRPDGRAEDVEDLADLDT